jgi:response regulator of citrate/malate metabolism
MKVQQKEGEELVGDNQLSKKKRMGRMEKMEKTKRMGKQHQKTSQKKIQSFQQPHAKDQKAETYQPSLDQLAMRSMTQKFIWESMEIQKMAGEKGIVQ